MDYSSINLDFSSNIPLYQQLSNAVSSHIQNGTIMPGELLLPERQLSQTLNLSRGTVRKAYEELKDKGLVTSRQGGGYRTLSSGIQDNSTEKQALLLAQAYLNGMKELGYSSNMAIDLLNLNAHTINGNTNKTIHVGAIECRPDIFYVYDCFFNQFRNIEVTYFLIDELLNIPELSKQAESCDILLITQTHADSIKYIYPELAPKFLEVIFNWSEESLERITQIQPDDCVGILYSNMRSAMLLKDVLKYNNIVCDVDVCNITNYSHLGTFFQERNVLIMEPSCPVLNEPRYSVGLKAFNARGGRRIIFSHYLDNNSTQAIYRALSRLLRDSTVSEAV